MAESGREIKAGRSAGLDHLQDAFDGRALAGLGEGSLLDRFVEHRDELAFAALLDRHGPMVLGVCRRILSDPRDVEDAFQATFLVFVRRAGTLGDRDRLAPWLFGVARKVATRARRDSSRRSAVERSVVLDRVENPRVGADQVELGRVLVEEIGRLPESLRGPVLLCCAEGLSYDEAANRLRSTVPAVRGRLSRARDRLRDRLARRGFAPSVALPGAWPWAARFSEVVPTALASSTSRLAIAFASGRSATLGAVPASVSLLAEGAIRTMIASKLKWATSAVIAVGLASGVGVLGQQPAGPALPLPPATAPADPPAPPQVAADRANDPFLNYYAYYLPRAQAEIQSQAAGESDRLASLEAKLDRLIQALERSAPPPAPVATPPRPRSASPFEFALPATATAPPPVQAARPARSLEERMSVAESNILLIKDRLVDIERRLDATPGVPPAASPVPPQPPAPATPAVPVPIVR